MPIPHPEALSDEGLLSRLAALLKQSRRVEAELVAHIAEVDRRRLYARQAFPSMFAYCTHALHLSETEAYLRITVARASRDHPMLLEMLADGRLHLSAIARLAPHLTEANREAVLGRAVHRSKREIEELVAGLAPRADVSASIRKLPERREASELSSAAPRDPGGPATPSPRELCPDRVVSRNSVLSEKDSPLAQISAQVPPDRGFGPVPQPKADKVAESPAPPPIHPAVPEPLAPGRYKVQFAASAGLRDKLERLQPLMRTSVPNGDLAAIIESAVTEKIERLEARRFAKTQAPRRNLAETDTSASSRHIPAAVRRAVHRRDGGLCRFVDEQGRRCRERQRLEFHHLVPYGCGGDHSPTNVRLMCPTHNRFLAEQDYGEAVMPRHRRSGNGVSPPAAHFQSPMISNAAQWKGCE